jgi:murein DD-endopeptidase MepM/ murein hydrolase activator NlpD
MKKVIRALVLFIPLSGCGGSGTNNTSPATTQPQVITCGPFQDWQTSDYVLPYAVGSGYQVNQGNCSGFGHSSFWTYGYDFIMDIGTQVTAMRSGTVFHVQDGTPDGNRIGTNLIIVEHQDGTFALYSHLTLGGVLVSKDQQVQAGNIIGLSGDTGNTGGLPHLHTSLHPCGGLPGLTGVADQNCPTVPYNFLNTEANPEGLIARRTYTAENY